VVISVLLSMCYAVCASGRALQGGPGVPIEIAVPFGVAVKTDFGTILGIILL